MPIATTPMNGDSPIPGNPGGNDFTTNPKGNSTPQGGRDFTKEHRAQPGEKPDHNPVTTVPGGAFPYSGPPVAQPHPFKLNP